MISKEIKIADDGIKHTNPISMRNWVCSVRVI